MTTAEIKDKADVVIVGSGAAGLFAALTLAPRRVLVLSEKPLGGVCASAWSQGGIAAAVSKEDSTESHVADTLKAGAGDRCGSRPRSGGSGPEIYRDPRQAGREIRKRRNRRIQTLARSLAMPAAAS